MAAPYSSSHKLATQNPVSVPLAIFITFFLLLGSKVSSALKFSYDLNKFQPDDPMITLQGDALTSPFGLIQLTRPGNGNSIGRVLYSTPLQLWDSSTGEVASFTTSFSFAVHDLVKPGEGFAFFIAPFGSEIPNNSDGPSLGLIDSKNGYNQIVAVEFDTNYENPYDPPYTHIGIDVNSLISLETVRWQSISATLMKVSIVYDSLSKVLSVLTTNVYGEITTISQVINLKAVLPETVSIGFSATTSEAFRVVHNLQSWSFTSTLESSEAKKGNITTARYGA